MSPWRITGCFFLAVVGLLWAAFALTFPLAVAVAGEDMDRSVWVVTVATYAIVPCALIGVSVLIMRSTSGPPE